MKKFLLSFSAAILITAGAQAQTGFGFKAGVNFSSYSYGASETLADAKSALNFHITGYVDAHIASWIYLQPEVTLQKKGAKLVESSLLGGTEITQSITWLDFPLNFVGKIPVSNEGSLFIGAGPYISFAMDGENKYPVVSGSPSTQPAFIFGKDNSWKSTDYGINFLTGFEFWNRFTLNANYRIGMANIAGNTNKWSKDIKNRVFSLGIGAKL